MKDTLEKFQVEKLRFVSKDILGRNRLTSGKMAKKKGTLIKEKVIMAHPKGKKPIRFGFKGNIRLGFRGSEVVEIVKFKKKK